MRRLGMLLVGVAVWLGSASHAEAQRFGAQVSWGDDSDVGLGARAEFDMKNVLAKTGAFANAFLITQFDWYFVDCNECSYFEINPSLAVPIPAQTLKPYLGGGLKISRFAVDLGAPLGTQSDTDVGVNLLGGLKFGLGNLDAFSEARISLGGHFEQLALSFGVLFGGSRSGATR